MKTLKFYKNEHGWFIDLWWWPFNKAHLAMIAGADKLLDALSDNKDQVKLKVSSNPKNYKNRNCDEILVRRHKDKLLDGAIYEVVRNNINHSLTVGYGGGDGGGELWLCAVTLCIYFRYPKFFYIHKIK